MWAAFEGASNTHLCLRGRPVSCASCNRSLNGSISLLGLISSGTLLDGRTTAWSCWDDEHSSLTVRGAGRARGHVSGSSSPYSKASSPVAFALCCSLTATRSRCRQPCGLLPWCRPSANALGATAPWASPATKSKRYSRAFDAHRRSGRGCCCGRHIRQQPMWSARHLQGPTETHRIQQVVRPIAPRTLAAVAPRAHGKSACRARIARCHVRSQIGSFQALSAVPGPLVRIDVDGGALGRSPPKTWAPRRLTARPLA